MSSRLKGDFRKFMDKKQACIETLNFAFPTIITSGSMMVLSGFAIGNLSSDATICGIGQCLGRGTTISIILVMFVLPQILLVGDTIISKTAFVMNMPIRTREATGLNHVNGIVRGRINGVVTGTMNAIVRGDLSAFVEAGNITPLTEDEAADKINALPMKVVNKEAQGGKAPGNNKNNSGEVHDDEK